KLLHHLIRDPLSLVVRCHTFLLALRPPLYDSRTRNFPHSRDSYGSDPPGKISDLLMRQAIAHRLQVKHLGGLNFSTRRALKGLLEESGAIRFRPHSPSQRVTNGTVLVREWHGVTHQVTATEKGVLYRGKLFRSLSEVAREITGTRWSGPLFFGLLTSSGESKRGTK